MDSRPDDVLLPVNLRTRDTLQLPDDPIYLDHEPSMETNQKRIIQWFCDNGGHLDKALRLSFNHNDGHHYLSKGNGISSGTNACTCPFNLTLSHLNVLSKRPANIRDYHNESSCAHLAHEVEDGTLAAFFLAEQRLQGEASFWAPYISLLPKECDLATPLWFQSEELLYLRGTNLLPHGIPFEMTTIGIQQNKYKEQWKLGISILERAGVSTDQYTWTIFLWAATIMTSRSFTSNIFADSKHYSFPILYPVLDIFNHKSGSKVKWQLNSGAFSLLLDEEVKVDQQVFNNYASKGNEELLMGYGFCVPGNQCDQVAFRLNAVAPVVHHRLRERIPDHWKSEIWNEQESVFYVRGALHYTSGYLDAYGHGRFECLRGIPPALAYSLYEIITANHEQEPVAEEAGYGSLIWASVVDALLQRTETTLSAITHWNPWLPETPSSSIRVKAAALYREGQIKILEDVIAELKAVMEPLRAGEIDVNDAFMCTQTADATSPSVRLLED